MSKNLNILLVDDEKVSALGLRALLTDIGHRVEWAGHGEDALKQLGDQPSHQPFHILITDLMMPGMDGFALVKKVKKLYPNLITFIFTGHDSFKLASRALSLGADDYLLKPVDRDQLQIALAQAYEKIELKNRLHKLGYIIENKFAQKLIGTSPAMLKVQKLIQKAAASRGNVLIRGESGTGKELVARAIYGSRASTNPNFVSVNCCAISEGLIESELFGHARGSFSGAVSDREGLFELADEGTIFLDEIGDIPQSVQMKLLRVIQEKEIRRIGENKNRSVDVRIIAATNADLERAMKEDRFRQDLYYRLNVIPIQLPSLRERPEDIPELVSHFLARYASPNAANRISEEALAALQGYAFPGNVRELENIVQRAMSFANSAVIEEKDIVPHLTVSTPSPTPATPPSASLKYRDFQEHQDEAEKKFLVEHLKRSRGVVATAAQRLGITRTALHNKIIRFGIDLSEVRGLVSQEGSRVS